MTTIQAPPADDSRAILAALAEADPAIRALFEAPPIVIQDAAALSAARQRAWHRTFVAAQEAGNRAYDAALEAGQHTQAAGEAASRAYTNAVAQVWSAQ